MSFNVGDKVRRHPDFINPWWIEFCERKHLNPYGVYIVEEARDSHIIIQGIPGTMFNHRFEPVHPVEPGQDPLSHQIERLTLGHSLDAAWSWRHKDDPARWTEKFGQMCHYALSCHDDVKKYDQLLYAHMHHKQMDVDVSKRFTSWLLDPLRSPWRDFVSRPDFVYIPDKAFHLKTLDWPNRLGANFLCASRASWEKSLRPGVEAWDVMVTELGIDPGFAFAFSMNLAFKDDHFSLNSSSNNNHWCLWLSSTDATIKRFVAGDWIETGCEPYGSCGQLRPTNDIWGQNGEGTKTTDRTWKYNSHINMKTKGAFGDVVVSVWTKDAMKEILQKEFERIMTNGR